MAARASSASGGVFSTVPLSHRGVDLPVGTNLVDLGLEDVQLDALVEMGEASREQPKPARASKPADETE